MLLSVHLVTMPLYLTNRYNHVTMNMRDLGGMQVMPVLAN